MAIVRDLIVLALCAIFLVHFSEGHTIKQRSIEPTADDTVTNNGGNTSNNGSIRTPTTEQPITEICIGRTPCGWAVYNRVNRFVEYFMKNKCICPEPRTCVRQDDDISITAYVYRCKIVDKNGEVVDSDNPFANSKSTK